MDMSHNKKKSDKDGQEGDAMDSSVTKAQRQIKKKIAIGG